MNRQQERAAERRVKVRLLRKEGRSRAEIADMMHVDIRTIDRDLRLMGMTVNIAWPWTARQVFEARQFLDDGVPYSEISRTLGMPVKSLQHKFPGRGRHGNPLGANSRAWRLSIELGLELVQ